MGPVFRPHNLTCSIYLARLLKECPRGPRGIENARVTSALRSESRVAGRPALAPAPSPRGRHRGTEPWLARLSRPLEEESRDRIGRTFAQSGKRRLSSLP